MGDHREMIHAAAVPAPAAMAQSYGGDGTGSAAQASHHGGDWWSAAAAPAPASSCSPEMPGFGAWSAVAAAGGHADVVDGGSNRSKSSNNTAASAESPGSNSLATGSSITFQEPTGAVADVPAATITVPQTVTAGFATGWNYQPFMDGSGFPGYMSSRNDHQNHINAPSLMSPSSSNNSMMQLQDHHDQNYQFLSNLGFELLSSPTSPYGGFRSSLLTSLTEPPGAAAGKPSSPESQQYQQTANQAPPACIGRQPLQFTNNTPFWSPSTGFATAAAPDGAGLGAAGAPPPPPETRPARLAAKSALEGVGDSSSVITKKDSTPLKKARTGALSPLPTFKVRKEKLGDRVTALQQLVSPFGKTDTASVLHETIEYIKFLHDQVGALSAPYLKNRQQVPHLKGSADKSKDGGDQAAAVAAKRDLTGRGLCLVPISSTFGVASETPVDFWTPFGAAFR